MLVIFREQIALFFNQSGNLDTDELISEIDVLFLLKIIF